MVVKEGGQMWISRFVAERERNFCSRHIHPSPPNQLSLKLVVAYYNKAMRFIALESSFKLVLLLIAQLYIIGHTTIPARRRMYQLGRQEEIVANHNRVSVIWSESSSDRKLLLHVANLSSCTVERGITRLHYPSVTPL
jgi:hypothetical protein